MSTKPNYQNGNQSLNTLLSLSTGIRFKFELNQMLQNW